MIRQIHHVCIQTECYQQSKTFYTDVLGFELIKEEPGFHTREFNSWLKGGGMMIELQTPKAGTQFREWSKLNSGPVHLGFLVDDVRATYERVKQHDGADFNVKNGKELYRVKNSWIFKVRAPEGTEIEIREDPELG